TTDILRADHPWSWRDWVVFFGSDWNGEIWNRFGVRLRGDDASRAAYGTDFFTYINEHRPEAGEAFNGAMASGSRVQGLLFAERYDFAGLTSMCDVGGGTGSVLVDVLTAHPGIRGTVFDLPALAPGAQRTIAAGGVA